MKKTGLYIGRFQPLTVGHTRVLKTMLEECENVIVVIGSTQEVGTEKNPFTFMERKRMLKAILFEGCLSENQERVKIVGLPDIFNPKGWAKYILDSIKLKIEEGEISFPFPDTYYCGSYYDGHFFENTELDVRIVDRTNPNFPVVSSSMIRQMCQYQDQRWKEYVPEQIWDMVQVLQDKYNWKEE